MREKLKNSVIYSSPVIGIIALFYLLSYALPSLTIESVLTISLSVPAILFTYYNYFFTAKEKMRPKPSLELKNFTFSFSPGQKNPPDENLPDGYNDTPSTLNGSFKIFNTGKVDATNVRGNAVFKDISDGRVVHEIDFASLINIPKEKGNVIMDFPTVYTLEKDKDFEIIMILKCNECPEGIRFTKNVKTG
ncbi:MAG: hypothetical protein NTU57_05065 [Candidatus Aenigmarchaeota archaeon]|nr:hypothetical protein [Candidatus Aenigmarchaeota archaeon]